MFLCVCVCVGQMVLGMNVDSEEDQMMRAIAMSLGENILMAVDEEV